MNENKRATFLLAAVVGIALVGYIAVSVFLKTGNPPQVFFTPEQTNQVESQADTETELAAKAVNTTGGGIVSRFDRQENRVVASLGLTDVLALYAGGVKGDGHDQMSAAMALEESNKEAFAALNHQFAGGEYTQIYRASGFWADKALEPDEDFVASGGNYRTRIEVLDFNDFASASKSVNDYLQTATQDKLGVAMDAIRPKSGMILVGADAFYGRLDGLAQADQPLTFSDTNGQSAAKDAVSGTVTAGFYEDEHVTYLALPLKDGYQLETVMPKNGIDDFSINHEKLVTYRKHAQQTAVQVTLPQIDLTSKQTVNSQLIGMGMEHLFSQPQAIGSNKKMAMSRVDSLCRVVLAPDDQASSGRANRTLTVNQPFYFAVGEVNSGASFATGMMVR